MVDREHSNDVGSGAQSGSMVATPIIPAQTTIAV